MSRRRAGILLVFRVALGTALALAGGIKLADPATFRRVIEAFDLVPDWLAVSTAVTLPVFELLCGVLLILNVRRRAMALAATALMIVFTAAGTWAAWKGIRCGCFGAIEWLDASPGMTILRNLVLLGMAVALLHHSHRDEGG